MPREQVFEITERIDSGGDVVVGLCEADVEAALDRFAERGIEAVAIAYLWSFANPAHEIRTREIVQRRFPELYVSCGFEVAPRISSYPRTTATVMNAQIGPLMRAYIDRIAEGARRRGYRGPLLLAQCDGGLLPAEAAREFPIGTLQSGPVGGIAGAAKASASLDDEDVIVADMGGTTFDVGAFSGGVLRRRNESVVERHLTHLRKVEIESVGAGGGSVAWLDRESGALRVGPQSAGADPGPICYGRGGTQVTVTDADLVLGVLNAERPLAGGLRLDLEAARKAVAELGRRDRAGRSALRGGHRRDRRPPHGGPAAPRDHPVGPRPAALLALGVRRGERRPRRPVRARAGSPAGAGAAQRDGLGLVRLRLRAARPAAPLRSLGLPADAVRPGRAGSPARRSSNARPSATSRPSVWPGASSSWSAAPT